MLLLCFSFIRKQPFFNGFFLTIPSSCGQPFNDSYYGLFVWPNALDLVTRLGGVSILCNTHLLCPGYGWADNGLTLHMSGVSFVIFTFFIYFVCYFCLLKFFCLSLSKNTVVVLFLQGRKLFSCPTSLPMSCSVALFWWFAFTFNKHA